VAGGQGAAEAVPQRFKTLFARAARLLRDWADAKQSGRGVPPGQPTKSAIAASGWEGGWENSSEDDEKDKGGGGAGGESINLWKPEIVSPKWRK
jgi:hypothetical protein